VYYSFIFSLKPGRVIYTFSSRYFDQ